MQQANGPATPAEPVYQRRAIPLATKPAASPLLTKNSATPVTYPLQTFVTFAQ